MKALEWISNYSGYDPEKVWNPTILVNGAPINAMSRIFMLELAVFVVDLQTETSLKLLT